MSRYRRVTYEDRCQIYALSKDGARIVPEPVEISAAGATG